LPLDGDHLAGAGALALQAGDAAVGAVLVLDKGEKLGADRRNLRLLIRVELGGGRLLDPLVHGEEPLGHRLDRLFELG